MGDRGGEPMGEGEGLVKKMRGSFFSTYEVDRNRKGGGMIHICPRYKGVC